MNIQDEIKELKAKLEELEKQIKEKEKFKNIKNRFIPKYADTYYYISSSGTIIENTWCDTDTDSYRISINNCFKTQEEAEKHKRILINTQKLKDLANRLNDGRKIDWKNRCQTKYFIILSNALHLDKNYLAMGQGTIHCLNENFLNKAIEEIGEEELIELIKG